MMGRPGKTDYLSTAFFLAKSMVPGAGLCGASTYPVETDHDSVATTLQLSNEEKSFLAEHPTVRMCADPGWLPYDKLDARGRHSGIFADYHALFRARIEIEVEMVPTRTWAECLELPRDEITPGKHNMKDKYVDKASIADLNFISGEVLTDARTDDIGLHNPLRKAVSKTISD